MKNKSKLLHQYFYEIPAFGYFKIETHQRLDELTPELFQIKCFKKKFGFWKERSTDSYSSILEATESLKKLLIRFDKLGKKIKEFAIE